MGDTDPLRDRDVIVLPLDVFVTICADSTRMRNVTVPDTFTYQ